MNDHDVEYIDSSELAARLQDPLLQVIDVRDSDYPGGHIPGAKNLPSTLWDDSYAASLAAELSGNKQRYIYKQNEHIYSSAPLDCYAFCCFSS